MLPSLEQPSEADIEPNCLSEEGVRVWEAVRFPPAWSPRPPESVRQPLSTLSSSELRWEDLRDSWLEEDPLASCKTSNCIQ